MAKNFSMAAPHSRRAAGEDQIFKTNREAQQASRQFGKDKVTNASVGALLDDQGRLVVIPSVIDTLRNLDAEDFAAYAPIAGLPEFLEASKKAAFRDNMPEGYMEVVATPGGSGAIRHTIWNYSEYGDSILTSDWYWGPYKTIAEEHGRKIETFRLFNEDFTFNSASFREKVQEIVSKQKRIVMLLNFPAHNPTGYSLSDEEWDGVLDVLRKNAEDSENRIVVFLDIAYMDYAGDSGRKFMAKFSRLPENVLTITAFSMSKGYTLYGMRCGAMIGLSSNMDIVQEFKTVNEFSNRGVWSNGTRPAMVVLSRIFSDMDLFNRVENEREALRVMLNSRAQAFMQEARKVGLTTCPYKSGFFISVPCENPKEIAEQLKKDNIFAVPVANGIRFAVCSVTEDKCRNAPSKMAKILGL